MRDFTDFVNHMISEQKIIEAKIHEDHNLMIGDIVEVSYKDPNGERQVGQFKVIAIEDEKVIVEDEFSGIGFDLFSNNIHYINGKYHATTNEVLEAKKEDEQIAMKKEANKKEEDAKNKKAAKSK